MVGFQSGLNDGQNPRQHCDDFQIQVVLNRLYLERCMSAQFGVGGVGLIKRRKAFDHKTDKSRDEVSRTTCAKIRLNTIKCIKELRGIPFVKRNQDRVF